MKVGLARYQSLVAEIDSLRLEKVGAVYRYNSLVDKHPHYKNRREETLIGTYTKKINALEKVKIRYEGGKDEG